MQHTATFPQMGAGFPPHLFENQRSLGADFSNAFNATAQQGNIAPNAFGMRDSMPQQMPSNWDFHLQNNPRTQYAVSDDEDVEDDE